MGGVMARSYKLTFPRILRSEWIKFFSLRSTWWMMVVTLLVNVGMCAAMAAVSKMSENLILTHPDQAQLPPGIQPGDLQPGDLGMLSYQMTQGCGVFGQLIFVILSILIITNEYSSGMIRSTFTAAPRRGRVLIAKVMVITILCVVVFAISLAAGWSLGYIIEQQSTGVDLSLTSSTSLRILGGFLAEMTLVAVFCFGLGAIIRSTPGSIGAAVGIILVLPIAIGYITGGFSPAGSDPTGWRKWLSDVSAFLPTNAGSTVVQIDPAPDAILSPWQGIAVLGGWTLLSIIIAMVVTWRRDV